MASNGSSISERARNSATVDPQEAMFDRELDDDALEKLLDERDKTSTSLLRAKKAFKEKDDLVKARLGEFELADGEVARCGRHRISKVGTPSGHREFDVAASSRLYFSLFE